MTGFGEAEGSVAGGTLRVEIRSVNHRFFNLSARLPADLVVFEADLRERLRRVFERGHLSVSVRWLSASRQGSTAFVLDLNGAREAMARLRELQAALGMTGEVPLDLVARQPEVFRTADQAQVAGQWEEIEPIVGEAAARCREARKREGELLARELEDRLRLLRLAASRVAELAPARLRRERDRLRAAVEELMGDRKVDDQRLAQELAFHAERLDITEELVRLDAHLDASQSALRDDGPAGKRLGFLAQEVGREINTIGSKANDAAIQHEVIGMKGELERFREQLENLE
jgi:uncharacterized protein (TIGR00255 family)